MKAALATLILGAAPVMAQAECRLALILGLDVSGSVDETEYRLQLDGLAGALLTPEVAQTILGIPDAPIRLYVFEWSGETSQRVILDWVTLSDRAALQAAATRISATTRALTDLTTGIGQAMRFGRAAADAQPDCWRRTLDLSGDGESNSGPRPREVRDTLGDMTVNGLAVGTDTSASVEARASEVKALRAYFENEVIVGPEAFVEVATGYDAFEDAMARKLLKEIQTFAVSEAGTDTQ